MAGSDALGGRDAIPVTVFFVLDFLEGFEFLRDHLHSHTLILSGIGQVSNAGRVECE
jgi:hypothetical protein